MMDINNFWLYHFVFWYLLKYVIKNLNWIGYVALSTYNLTNGAL